MHSNAEPNIAATLPATRLCLFNAKGFGIEKTVYYTHYKTNEASIRDSVGPVKLQSIDKLAPLRPVRCNCCYCLKKVRAMQSLIPSFGCWCSTSTSVVPQLSERAFKVSFYKASPSSGLSTASLTPIFGDIRKERFLCEAFIWLTGDVTKPHETTFFNDVWNQNCSSASAVNFVIGDSVVSAYIDYTSQTVIFENLKPLNGVIG